MQCYYSWNLAIQELFECVCGQVSALYVCCCELKQVIIDLFQLFWGHLLKNANSHGGKHEKTFALTAFWIAFFRKLSNWLTKLIKHILNYALITRLSMRNTASNFTFFYYQNFIDNILWMFHRKSSMQWCYRTFSMKIDTRKSSMTFHRTFSVNLVTRKSSMICS